MIPADEEQKNKMIEFGFRLLNSEIGNDQGMVINMKITIIGFRLLNSEIGNDLK